VQPSHLIPSHPIPQIPHSGDNTDAKTAGTIPQWENKTKRESLGHVKRALIGRVTVVENGQPSTGDGSSSLAIRFQQTERLEQCSRPQKCPHSAADYWSPPNCGPNEQLPSNKAHIQTRYDGEYLSSQIHRLNANSDDHNKWSRPRFLSPPSKDRHKSHGPEQRSLSW